MTRYIGMGLGFGWKYGGGGGSPVTTQIDLTPSTLIISPGDTGTVVGTAEDVHGTPTGATVTYTSSDPNVLTVNASTGAYVGITSGSATLTATAGAITATASVTVQTLAQRVVAALGGDANVGGIFLDTAGITNTSGRASAWKDARGGSFPTMAEVSSSGPTITGGQLVFDGTNYLTVASALITGTDNWAILTIRQAKSERVGTQPMIASAGSGASTGFSITVDTAVGGPTGGTFQESLGGLFNGIEWVSTNMAVTSEPVTGSNTNLADQSFRRIAGVTTTRWRGAALTGATTDAPSAPSPASYIGWNGQHDKFKGIIRAVVFVKVDPGSGAFENAESLLLDAYSLTRQFTSIAAPSGAWTTIAQLVPVGTSFNGWTPSAALEGGLPVIITTPPSPMVGPAVQARFLLTTADGSNQDRNTGVDYNGATPVDRHSFFRLKYSVMLDPNVNLATGGVQRKFLYPQATVTSGYTNDTHFCVVSSFGGQLSTIQGYSPVGGAPQEHIGPNVAGFTFSPGVVYVIQQTVRLESAFGIGDGYFKVEIDGVTYHEDFNCRFSDSSWIGVYDPALQSWDHVRVGQQADATINFDEYRYFNNVLWEKAAV